MTRLFVFSAFLFRTFVLALACAALFGGARGAAADDLFDSGKLLMTGGVSPIEGAGGGGLVPWALITGYGTRDAIGGNVHYTYVGLNDYDLQTGGVAVGLFDRVELSYARQAFQTGDTGATLGLGRGFTFHQDIIGAKVRLFGDAIFDQDIWLPQVSVGAQYKINDRTATVKSLGAKDDTGVDYYVAASKLFLAQSVLATPRSAPRAPISTASSASAAARTTITACSSRARWPICCIARSRSARNFAASRTTSPSPRKRMPATFSPPSSSTRTSRSPPLTSCWATSPP